MKNKTTIIKWSLFITGFFVELFSFFISNNKNLQFIEKIFSPSQIEIRKGIETLAKGGKSLNLGDPGFEEISFFIIDDFSRNSPEYLKDTKYDTPKEILSRMKKGSYYMITTRGPYQYGIDYNRQLTIEFSNPNEHHGELRLNELVDGVNRYYDMYYFKLSFLIFITGFILQIIGFVVDTNKSNINLQQTADKSPRLLR